MDFIKPIPKDWQEDDYLENALSKLQVLNMNYSGLIKKALTFGCVLDVGCGSGLSSNNENPFGPRRHFEPWNLRACSLLAHEPELLGVDFFPQMSADIGVYTHLQFDIVTALLKGSYIGNILSVAKKPLLYINAKYLFDDTGPLLTNILNIQHLDLASIQQMFIEQSLEILKPNQGILCM